MAETTNNSHSKNFHPPRITKPKRVVTAAQHLQAVPREIVHQILDGLTVFEVLQIASCQGASAYIDQCLLGHPQYQNLFVSQDVLDEIRDLFIIFYQLCTSLNLIDAPEDLFLVKTLSSNRVPSCRQLIDDLQRDASRILNSISPIRLNSLNEASKESHKENLEPLRTYQPNSCQVLYDRWRLTLALEQNINSIKAAQLTKMAELYKAFPSLLKSSGDPSQKARLNTKHVTIGFQSFASIVCWNHWLNLWVGDKNYPYCGHEKWLTADLSFKYHLLPLVPFDWCLRLFVRKLHEDAQSIGIHASMLRESKTDIRQNRKKVGYPEKIVQDIKTVIAGMAYVYTTAEPGSKRLPPKVIRTKFTPYSLPFQRPYSPDGTKNRQMATLPTVIQKDVAQYEHWQPLDQNVAHLFPRKAFCYLTRNFRNLHAPTPFAQTACPDDCWDPSHEHPVFTSPPYDHFGELYADKIVESAQPSWERLMPYDEREFEWLEALLRAVTFMKETEDRKDMALSDFETKCNITDQPQTSELEPYVEQGCADFVHACK